MLKAVKKNRFMLDLTPMTWLGYRTKRLSPAFMRRGQTRLAGYLENFKNSSATRESSGND